MMRLNLGDAAYGKGRETVKAVATRLDPKWTGDVQDDWSGYRIVMAYGDLITRERGQYEPEEFELVVWDEPRPGHHERIGEWIADVLAAIKRRARPTHPVPTAEVDDE